MDLEWFTNLTYPDIYGLASGWLPLYTTMDLSNNINNMNQIEALSNHVVHQLCHLGPLDTPYPNKGELYTGVVFMFVFFRIDLLQFCWFTPN